MPHLIMANAELIELSNNKIWFGKAICYALALYSFFLLIWWVQNDFFEIVRRGPERGHQTSFTPEVSSITIHPYMSLKWVYLYASHCRGAIGACWSSWGPKLAGTIISDGKWFSLQHVPSWSASSVMETGDSCDEIALVDEKKVRQHCANCICLP